MPRPPPVLRCALSAGALCLALRASAQQPEAPPPAAEPDAAPATRWEGAIGLTTAWRPEYSGASRQKFKLTPALFLRYGRFTVTNASGFVTRRADDVARGLAVDMLRSDSVRVNLALRFDAGRSDNTAAALNGLGDIKPTVRGRLAGSWQLGGPWRVGASWSPDLLGRGGGHYGDVSFGWEHRITPATVLAAGGSMTLGGERYMRAYFGVDDAQAARTGYAVYRPGAGARDITLSINGRHDIGSDWIVLAGASATRLVGPAAASPLTTRRFGWGLSGGAAWRF